MPIWTDATLRIIQDGEDYRAPDGTLYPAGWPRADIPGVQQVAETQTPTDPSMITTGWAVEMVKGVPTQVWSAEPVLLADAQVRKVATLSADYAAACAQPVSYTTKGGVTKTFQADAGSVHILQQTLAGLSGAQTTPPDFWWLSADNTQVPFTYADLQGVAAAMLAQGWAAFQQLQSRKAAVNAATTVAAVQEVHW